jgi:hypothetical protein
VLGKVFVVKLDVAGGEHSEEKLALSVLVWLSVLK